MKTSAQNAATVTPKVVKVKLENGRVRVLEFISDPGDKEGWHSHPAFVVYVVTGGTLRINTPDGKSSDVEFKTGDVRYRSLSHVPPRTSARPNSTPSSSSWRRRSGQLRELDAVSRDREDSMTITCFIRYEIDPFQRDAFQEYAANWARVIPRCGGHLVGYFLPHEGTNTVAWGLIAFDNLAAYEAYRARLREDPEARANFALAQSRRFILREERTFVEVVESTFGVPAIRPKGKA